MILVCALGFNFIGLLLGTFVPVRPYELSDTQESFFLNFRTIRIRTTADGLFEPAIKKELDEELGAGFVKKREDLGLTNMARIEVSLDSQFVRNIYSSYDYSEWFGDDPVYVRYAFCDLDFFPDLVLDTNQKDYYVSGFTGQVRRKFL